MLRVAKVDFCGKFRKVPLNLEDEIDIRGKIVVITGSNSGIGKVAAFEMAKRGAVVVMACRDVPKAENVVQEIKNKFPEAVLVI
jgi:NAD(P)-dependent dehydrogenase (short-subunit alcohol dehydrogenase family)